MGNGCTEDDILIINIIVLAESRADSLAGWSRKVTDELIALPVDSVIILDEEAECTWGEYRELLRVALKMQKKL